MEKYYQEVKLTPGQDATTHKAIMKYLKTILATILASVLVCAFPLAAAASLPRTNFENQIRLNTKFYKDAYFTNSLNTYFGVNGFWLQGTSYNSQVKQLATLGQQSVLTIPDPGAATANFVLDQGTQTIGGTWLFPAGGIQFKGTSFNSTLKQLATLGQATTFSLPDPGASTDTVATLAAANAFTGVNSFSLANGIVLKGTSHDDTIKAAAATGQAVALTVHDVGGATGEIYTMTASQTAAGVLSRADMVTETSVRIGSRILECKNLAGTTITASAGAGVFGLSTTATFGSPSQLSLVTEAANNNTKTDSCEFEIVLPPDYVAGSAIDVAVTQAITIGGGTLSAKTLTVDAFKVAADGTVGSNLGPAAGTLTNSSTTLHNAITPTGLVAGNKLLIQLQTVLTETASSNVTANLTDIAVTTSVKM